MPSLILACLRLRLHLNDTLTATDGALRPLQQPAVFAVSGIGASRVREQRDNVNHVIVRLAKTRQDRAL